jgi:hypothetical protein
MQGDSKLTKYRLLAGNLLSCTFVVEKRRETFRIGRRSIEGDLEVKGIITNDGSNGEVLFGQVCLGNSGNGCYACGT